MMKTMGLVLVLLLKKKVMVKSSVAACGFPSIPGDSDQQHQQQQQQEVEEGKKSEKVL